MDSLKGILDFFVDFNFRKGRLLIIGTALFIFFFSIIDNNFLYFIRIKNRIEILNEVTKINTEIVNQNKELLSEYDSIMNDIKMHRKSFIISNNEIFNQRTIKKVKLYKIFSGAIVFIMLFVISIFVYKGKSKIKPMFNFAILSVIFGWIGYWMPTFRMHQINYFGAPLLILLYLYMKYSDKRRVTEVRYNE